MDYCNEQLKAKLKYYRKLEETIRAQLDSAPDGKLVISLCKGKYPQFYKSEGSAGNSDYKKTFLSAKNTDLIKRLAQKDYNQKLLNKLFRQTEVLNSFLKEYDPDFITEVYQLLLPKEQEFVKPVVLPTEEYIKKWMSDYQGSQNPWPFPSDDLTTNRGEKVRSKSERALADRLEQRGIPYKYEHPLFVKSWNRQIYPDFQCLNVRTRRTYVWEHIGKTDAENYIKDVDDKLTYLQKDGYFPGEKLIVTYENKLVPLSLKVIDHMIDMYLL